MICQTSYRKSLVVCLLLAIFLVAGCNGRPYITAERSRQGLVMILPGIEGPSVLNASIRQGLMDGGLPYALEIYNWHGPRTGFAFTYAWSETACRKRAAAVASRVQEYRAVYPGRPVFIVGHSAGGGIAIFAAEEIPEEDPIDGVIAIAPSLGPDYDLTKALTGAGGHVASCSSDKDMFLRGLITVGRNIDGDWGVTAGQQGFEVPIAATTECREAYSDLVQIRWTPDMAEEGNTGGHFGWTSPAWVAAHLVPIIDQWSHGGSMRTAAVTKPSAPVPLASLSFEPAVLRAPVN